MEKKGVSKIYGVIAPRVGVEYAYQVIEWYPDTPFSERNPLNVTWELFKKRRSGQFTTTNIKKKGISSFTFGESSVGHEYILQAYLYAPEGGGITYKATKHKNS